MTGPEVIELLGLVPLEHEGGHWTQTWIDDDSTAIYYLIQPDSFSAFHRLAGVELYHHDAGAPAELWTLHPDGSTDVSQLGSDLAAGERPVHAVPPLSWQAARTLGQWSLLGCSMAPPYRAEAFELARRQDLLTAYPDHTAEILALTRLIER